MPTYSLPNNVNNTGGIDGAFRYISDNVPSFSGWILLFVFLVIALGGYFSKSRREGSEKAGNLPMWFAIAGLITTTGAFILFLANGLISLATLVICVVVTIISAIWFLFSSDN